MAQFAVGRVFDTRTDLPRDPQQAAKWYRLAGQQGHPAAKLYYAILLQKGDGVTRDIFQATKLYREVAALPDVGGSSLLAQVALGELYFDGGGFAEAAKWFRAPADAGHGQAQYYMGWLYAFGRGVIVNDSLAVLWFEKSARNRNPKAMGFLVGYLVVGRGTKADTIMAYVWSQLSAELDPNESSNHVRKAIQERCTPQQIEQGKKIIQLIKDEWNQNIEKE